MTLQQKSLFKTHASLGKSILTSALPDEKHSKDQSDSVFDIALEAGLKEIFVVEDTMASIFELSKNSEKLDIKLRFGLQVRVGSPESNFKQILFAANKKGVQDLFKIYSKVQCEHEGVMPLGIFENLDCENLHLVCPFYNSWLDRNLRRFGTFMPNFPAPVSYALEDNDLPFDALIRRQILKDVSRQTFEAKTILYKNREDCDAYLVYRLACNEKIGGKKPSFESPNLDGFGSREFCWEALK